jgi:hypothetical protein
MAELFSIFSFKLTRNGSLDENVSGRGMNAKDGDEV